jgi:hypothetical protein
MSALLSSPSGGDNDSGARLERVKLLREHRGFQWYEGRLTELRDTAMRKALNGATVEERETSRVEYQAYLKAIDILDSEERAATAALKQKQPKE